MLRTSAVPTTGLRASIDKFNSPKPSLAPAMQIVKSPDNKVVSVKRSPVQPVTPASQPSPSPSPPAKPCLRKPTPERLAKNRDLADVFVIQPGKVVVVPELAEEVVRADRLDEYGSWNEAGEFNYVGVVLLYAMSLEGGLVYDQQRFAVQYSPVFGLLGPQIVSKILDQLFSPAFVKVYSQRRAGDQRLNFFTVALFFAQVRECNALWRTTKLGTSTSRTRR